MLGKIRRFVFHSSRYEKSLFLEALFLQIWIKILILFIPFKRYTVWFANTEKTNLELDITQLLAIKKAIHRANRVTNWHNQCLVMSLCARTMMKSRKANSTLYLGLHLENKKLKAHAWISANEIELVEKDGSYEAIFTF